MIAVEGSSAALVPAPAVLLAIVLTAFLAATVASVAGFGGSVILLPVLVPAFGVREAVLILTVVQLFGNASRVLVNRTELEPRVVGWFSIGAVPFAVLGGIVFATAPLTTLLRLLGLLLLGMVVWRHLPKRPARAMPTRGFAVVGAVSSFVSAVVGTVGPMLAPFFLAYGLTKGAYIGTEALATVVIQLAKVGTYAGTAILSTTAVVAGLALAPVMLAGAYLGKRVLARMSDAVFVLLVELTMIVAGVGFLLGG